MNAAEIRRLREQYVGANHADLCALLNQLADVNAAHTGPADVIAHALHGISDTLGNLADGGGRDVLSVAEHRVEAGLCPDTAGHWGTDCSLYDCPTWRRSA